MPVCCHCRQVVEIENVRPCAICDGVMCVPCIGSFADLLGEFGFNTQHMEKSATNEIEIVPNAPVTDTQNVNTEIDLFDQHLSKKGENDNSVSNITENKDHDSHASVVVNMAESEITKDKQENANQQNETKKKVCEITGLTMMYMVITVFAVVFYFGLAAWYLAGNL